MFCFGIAIFLSININPFFFFLMLINIILAIVYSAPPLRLRNVYLLSNIIIAITFGLVPAIMGSIVLNESNPLNISLLVCIFALSLSLGFTKDLEDFIGDKAHGVHTLPAVMGLETARRWIIGSIMATYLLILLLTFLGVFKPSTYILIIFLPWVWHLNNLAKMVQKRFGNYVLLNSILIGGLSVLCLAILNI